MMDLNLNLTLNLKIPRARSITDLFQVQDPGCSGLDG
jgi:hypothetical protein